MTTEKPVKKSQFLYALQRKDSTLVKRMNKMAKYILRT